MKKYGKSEKIGGFRGFFKGKSEFWGFWGIKSRVLDAFWGGKGGYFDGFIIIGGGFWVK